MLENVYSFGASPVKAGRSFWLVDPSGCALVNDHESDASSRPAVERDVDPHHPATMTVKLSSKLLILAAALGCGSDGPCLALPCAFPIPILVTLKSATGLPLDGFVRETDASGTVLHTTDCPATGCIIGSGPGTYHLVIGRQGFVSKQMTVNVEGRESGECSCASVDTQRLDVTLVVDPTQGIG